MESHSTSEVSLRHLPDLSESDTSFSFQIPHTVTSADLLTNTHLNLGDADDFFSGVREDEDEGEDSFTTPGSPESIDNAKGSLTLSMLTPKPHRREPAIALAPSPPPASAGQNTRATAADTERKGGLGNEVAKRRTMGVDAIASSPVGAKRFADLKAGVEFLLQDALEDDAGIFAPSNAQPSPGEQPAEAAKPQGLSPRVNEAKRRTKPTVADGGITKKVPLSVKPVSRLPAATTKPDAAAASRLASARLKPKPLPAAEGMIRPDGDAIMDMPNQPPAAPASAAARLLQYGQSLIAQSQPGEDGYEADEAIVTVTADETPAPSEDASIRQASPPPWRLNTTDTLNALAQPVLAAQLPSPIRAQDDPFTLSQISPRKASAAGPSALPPRSPSPARVTRARKRPAEDQDAGEDSAAALPPHNKKHKGKPAAVAVAAAKQPRGLTKSRSGASSSARPAPSTRQTRSARQAAIAALGGGAPPSGGGADAPRIDRGPSRGTGNPNPKACSTTTGGDQKANTRTARATGTRGARVGLGRPAATITPSVSVTIQTASVPGPSSPPRSGSAATTTPAEFTFRAEARLAARKASHPAGAAPLLATEPARKAAIPDFASLHAASLASSVAFRAAHAPTPTVPVPLALSTDARAREREAFDAAVREREAEAERVRAEKRREREEEEEREMGEMRRQTVIRAHEVPEWYADAPKRAHGR